MNNDNMSSSSSSFGGDSQQQGGLGKIPGAQEIAGSVKQMASQAGEKLMDQAERQKAVGADFVGSMADAVRRAAGEFEDQAPQAADYIRYAADQMNSVSDSLRRRDMGQMVSDVQSFARRQPAAFLGLSLLAGFAAVRFLRSSAPGFTSGGSSGMGSNAGGGMGNNAFQSGGATTDQSRYGAPIASMSAPPRGMQEL